MRQQINVLLPGIGVRHVPRGTSLLDLGREVQAHFCGPILAAKVDNVVEELTATLEQDCTVEFLDITTEEGHRVYLRSLTFILIRAARELAPGCTVTVEHSLGKGLYCEWHCGKGIDDTDLTRLTAKMREIIAADEPFIKEALHVDEACRLFISEGREEKSNILKYCASPVVGVYRCGWLRDHFYGPLAPSTGYISLFRLHLYPPGFILQFPDRGNPFIIPPFVDQPKLAGIFREAERWGEILECGYVSALNEYIASRRAGELVRIAEALHEKKIAEIADLITANKKDLRLVLIAGPSSSGKTTFAQRLMIQLRVNGVRPIAISIDDYFINREATPRDEDGNYDFESIYALDLALFNDHLTRLLQGETVEIPIYNFKTGRREERGRKMTVAADQPLIIEGIHGLNEQLTAAIPKAQKYKIYISVLTQLSIDNHNRIPTTDARKVRRIVRDSWCRNHDALKTLRQWPSVRRGEERNIFPFQEEADIMFNSALIYELAVLKTHAEPLLAAIGREHPEYAEARRLLDFLSYFLPLDAGLVPDNSILREFIGGSCFFDFCGLE